MPIFNSFYSIIYFLVFDNTLYVIVKTRALRFSIAYTCSNSHKKNHTHTKEQTLNILHKTHPVFMN